MDTLIDLNRKDIITQAILLHIELFKIFKNVYLFGSTLNVERCPNDIDLLLIYQNFSYNILADLSEINNTFSLLYGFTFDFTVLSEKEEEEIDFIARLNSKYIKLK